MKKSILLEKLKAVGMNEREARIYLATLEHPHSPVSRIAAAAQMNRVTAYGVLEKLLEKGVMSVSDHKGVQYFTAVAPDILAEDVRQKAESLHASLPFLRSLTAGQAERPTVRFFEGIEAVKHAYRETLKAHTEILNYANSRNIRSHWLEYDREYVQKRTEKTIFLKGLAPDDSYGKKVRNEDRNFHRETRLIDPKHFQVENEIKIFDDKVFIASFEPKPFALLIESAAVADTQRQIFEIIWSFTSPELTKK